jgi:signal transduction histidine kinase
MNLIKYKNHNFILHFKENLLAFSLFFLGIFHLLSQIKFGVNSFGDLLDGRLNNFFLEHFYRAFIGEEESFKNANFFHPLPNVMMLSDNNWLLCPIYTFFRFLGFNSAKSFNFWIFCGFFANFISSYYALRKFNFSKNSSAIGAYLFTFNQIILLKIGHVQLNFKIFIPLTLLYSKQYFETLDFKYISYIILCVILQLLCNSYTGNFLALFVVIFFLCYLSKFKKDDFHQIFPQKFSLKITVPILILSVFLLILYGLPYTETKNIYNLNFPKTTGEYFELKSLFIAGSSPIWNFITNHFSLKFLEIYRENQFFIGIGAWLAILTLIFNKKIHKNLRFFDKIVIKSILFTLFFFWLDKYLETFSFIQSSFPSFTNLRAYNRFFFVIFFAIIYLITLVISYLETTKNSKRILYYFIVFIIVIESQFCKILNSNFEKEQLEEVKKYKDLILKNGDKNSITLFVINKKQGNLSDNFLRNEINAMIASQDLGIKAINGYSSISFFMPNLANNCQEISKIIEYNEDSASKILKKEFKYDRKNLLVFFDQKLCPNIFKK